MAALDDILTGYKALRPATSTVCRKRPSVRPAGPARRGRAARPGVLAGS
jgi:hypothetical protein